MDGEPWEQPVPDGADGGKLTLTVRRAGQNRVLFNRHAQHAMPAWVRQVAEANADALLEGDDGAAGGQSAAATALESDRK